MVKIQSGGAIAELGEAYPSSHSSGSLTLYDHWVGDYATIYKTQPNVRICVDFLARNVAQLQLHLFARRGESDRERLRDAPLAQLLWKPLPPIYKVTQYRLIESTMVDLGVYFNAFWLKLRGVDGVPIGLLRIPASQVTVHGNLVPTAYTYLDGNGKERTAAPSEIVHFRGPSVLSAVYGLSPMETLRRILAEDQAADDYRQGYWLNGARIEGIITRPATSPAWSPEARDRFLGSITSATQGKDNSGKTILLEDGMDWKPIAFNPRQSEYMAGRHLTREECARQYNIPPPLIGILDHATFSNIREQHKNLYQDCLGPWLAMIEQDLMLQLMTDFPGMDSCYLEFNIYEKLQGSFEEQAAVLQAAIGRPWMTANEGRSRANLPNLPGDADQLVTPLNVLVGGQASPQDSDSDAVSLGKGRKAQEPDWTFDAQQEEMRTAFEERWAETFRRHFARQRDALQGRVKASINDPHEIWRDQERWNRELAKDLFPLMMETAMAWAMAAREGLGIEEELTEAEIGAWISVHARYSATNINQATYEQFAEALRNERLDASGQPIPPRDRTAGVWALALGVRALELASGTTTAMASFGTIEVAKRGNSTKTWHSNTPKTGRLDHKLLAGETVPVRERFSNGMMWPGDPAGGAENNANCRCSITIQRYKY